MNRAGLQTRVCRARAPESGQSPRQPAALAQCVCAVAPGHLSRAELEPGPGLRTNERYRHCHAP